MQTRTSELGEGIRAASGGGEPTYRAERRESEGTGSLERHRFTEDSRVTSLTQ